MKNRITVTLIVSTIMVALLYTVSNYVFVEDEKIIKAGFLYVGDGATAYTENFMKAQEAIERTYGENVICIAKYNVLEGYEDVYIDELVNEGCDIIFGTSYGYGSGMKNAAKNNPDVQFCQATSDNAIDEPCLPNYHTFMGHIYEGRYVSGVIAGLKLNELIDKGEISKSEALVGYVAAFPYAEVISGYTAFILGVRSQCPSAVMKVKYTNTWSGYAIEKQYAKELIDEGCVIISQHSDTTGPAIACETSYANHPVYIVSYNDSMLDVAPITYLGGCRINWEIYEVAAIQALLKDKKIEDVLDKKVIINGTDAGAGFSCGWVEMLETNYVVTAANTKQVVEKTIKDFINGKIRVFVGDYTGVNPFDDNDRIDLKTEFVENEKKSAPSFNYVLDDIIIVE